MGLLAPHLKHPSSLEWWALWWDRGGTHRSAPTVAPHVGWWDTGWDTFVTILEDGKYGGHPGPQLQQSPQVLSGGTQSGKPHSAPKAPLQPWMM